MSEETETKAGATVGVVKEPNEVFWGSMVAGVISLLLGILIVTFGYYGYRLWQASELETKTPSIQELSEQPKAATETEQSVEAAPTTADTKPAVASTETPAGTAAAASLATLEVKVLNGGAVKGSAGTLVENLKKAGYTKAAFGNSVGDYTGVAIYHGAAFTEAAEALKTVVAKTYPAVTVAPAKAGDKDATAAALVIILGK